MKALVVYESLFGNTSTIARAIAEGLGTRALSTAEATAAEIADVDLIVAGAPIHILGLPSAKTREDVRTGGYGQPPSVPDLSHPPMREWLAALPKRRCRSAAFETGVDAWYGHGAATKIARGFERVGYAAVVRPQRFNVTGRPLQPTAFGVLCEGEIERARQWGVILAKLLEPETAGSRLLN
jgi:hypothetical protein